VDLKGKIALITGAASGMGAATAREFASRGSTVIGADVADGAGRELFAELGSPHRYVHLNVADADEWQAALAGVDRLDFVFLNAGVMTRPPSVPILDDPLDWLRPDAFRKVMGVNVDGVGFGLAATIPLLEAEGGDIIVTSSTAGVQAYEPDPVYSGSKYAVIGLSRSLTPWLAKRGIRINVICPHSILTGIVPEDLRALPDKKFSPPSYIAESVIRILESGETGHVWMARAKEEPAWQVEYTDVTPKPSYILERAPS
jgi:NAD(P)-dependent dehydrogenase (short-subunit alcohol dehydrogenase family)